MKKKAQLVEDDLETLFGQKNPRYNPKEHGIDSTDALSYSSLYFCVNKNVFEDIRAELSKKASKSEDKKAKMPQLIPLTDSVKQITGSAIDPQSRFNAFRFVIEEGWEKGVAGLQAKEITPGANPYGVHEENIESFVSALKEIASSMRMTKLDDGGFRITMSSADYDKINVPAVEQKEFMGAYR